MSFLCKLSARPFSAGKFFRFHFCCDFFTFWLWIFFHVWVLKSFTIKDVLNVVSFMKISLKTVFINFSTNFYFNMFFCDAILIPLVVCYVSQSKNTPSRQQWIDFWGSFYSAHSNMHNSTKKQRTNKRKRNKLRITQHSVFLAFILYGRPFMKFSDKILGRNMSHFLKIFVPFFLKNSRFSQLLLHNCS